MSNQQRRADLPRHRNALADFQGAGYSALKPLADDIDAGLRKFLGPEGYAAFRRATGVADIVSPGADFRDAVQSSGEMVRNAISGNALGAVGSGAGMAAALGSVMIPGNTNALAKMADDAPAVGKKGIRAFHGSPHDFDKFSLDKIGTGEGAQAYGHGLYFAENERVADLYRAALSAPPNVDASTAALGEVYFSNSGKNSAKAKDIARKELDDSIGFWNKSNYSAREKKDAIEREWTKFNKISNYIDELGNVGLPGRMYEVNINADPDEFYDFDALMLSEQSPSVVEKLRKEFGVIPQQLEYRQTIDGKFGIYEPNGKLFQVRGTEKEAADYVASHNATPNVSIADITGQQKPEIAERLRKSGIPGIKYLDAGSRGAGDGSRNYVVFDDSLVEILRKYGIGALVAGGAYALTDAEYAQAQEIIGDDNADDR